MDTDFYDDPTNEPEEDEPQDETLLNERLRTLYQASTPEERGENEDG